MHGNSADLPWDCWLWSCGVELMVMVAGEITERRRAGGDAVKSME